MSSRPVRSPGPDHPITIQCNPSPVRVTLGGRVLADTRNALTLREAHYPAVQYIPRSDVDMALLTRSEHTTYCPFKGECSYFNLPVGTANAINAVWTYETPFEAVAKIGGHLAFYPDRVTIEGAEL